MKPVGDAVGASIPRLETKEKVTGKAQYADDLRLEGMLHGAMLLSPYAHARILSYDTSKAKALPGVKAVVTGADLPEAHFGPFVRDQVALARGKVRYIGEPVAAVAASDLWTARRATQLIEVVYDELPAVFDPDEALAPGAPVLHENYKDYVKMIAPADEPNVTSYSEFVEGDVDSAWAKCDVIVEGEYTVTPQQHMYMEPCSALADVDASGKVTVWSSTQSIFGTQSAIAAAVGLPTSKVRSIAPRIGGGFGGKYEFTIEPMVAALAIAAGKPVKLTLSREEDMMVMKSRHRGRLRLRTGAAKDGTIIAREGEITLDGGAYCDDSPAVLGFACMRAAGPYRIPHLRFRGKVVYTNHLRASAFRGFGNPQATFAAECQIDDLAAKLGMDPLELRIKNAKQTGDPWLGGTTVEVGSLKECLIAARDSSRWTERRKSRAAAPGKRRGIGCASIWHVCAMVSAGANVRLHEDGSVTVNTGAVDLGQGSDTALAQICAGALGLPIERVNYARQDTDMSPWNFATAASRTTYMVGTAVAEASERVREQLFRAAGEMLECAERDLELRPGGRVGIKGVPERELRFADISARAIWTKGGQIGGTHNWTFTGPPVDPKRAAASGFSLAGLGINTFGVQIVELEVDEATGKIDVLEAWSAHDVGKAINPQIVEGQIQGGFVQGLGYAISEELVWDSGKLANPSLMDYKIPGALDAPYDIHPIILEIPEQSGPFGAKGVAESSLVGVAPAVSNALFHATGVRVADLPITGERVLRGLVKMAAE